MNRMKTGLRPRVPKHIKPMFHRDQWRILRGDKVQIITGKDKGEIGIVKKVIRDKRVPKLIVEGRNLVTGPPI
jgi:KOW motif